MDKCDYTKHPEYKKLIDCKASAHEPEWIKLPPKTFGGEIPTVKKNVRRRKKSPDTTAMIPIDKDFIMSE